jgi:hypothetical protein
LGKVRLGQECVVWDLKIEFLQVLVAHDVLGMAIAVVITAFRKIAPVFFDGVLNYDFQ